LDPITAESDKDLFHLLALSWVNMKEPWKNINMETAYTTCQSDSDHGTVGLTYPRIVDLQSEISAGLSYDTHATFAYNHSERKECRLTVKLHFTLCDSHSDRRSHMLNGLNTLYGTWFT